MNDLIKRQEAIDTLLKWMRPISINNEDVLESDDMVAVRNILKSLPSAHPEVIRCKDCIYQTESWSGIKYCEAHGDHIGKDYDYCSNARRKENGCINK